MFFAQEKLFRIFIQIKKEKWMKILNLGLYSKNIYRFANTKQNFINFKSNDLKQDTFESKQNENDNPICKKSKYYIDYTYYTTI